MKLNHLYLNKQLLYRYIFVLTLSSFLCVCLQLTPEDQVAKAWGMIKTNHCPPYWPEWEETLRYNFTYLSIVSTIPSTYSVIRNLSLLIRCWASMLDKGRPSWMQWCVMGCLPRMPSPPSGSLETCEANQRRSSSESDIPSRGFLVIYFNFIYLSTLPVF